MQTQKQYNMHTEVYHMLSPQLRKNYDLTGNYPFYYPVVLFQYKRGVNGLPLHEAEGRCKGSSFSKPSGLSMIHG